MSLARSRMSVAPVSGGVAARLSVKQAELQALQQLRVESAQLTQELEKLSERIDTLVVGGQSVASVMDSWQGVFRAIQIAQAAMLQRREVEKAHVEHENVPAEDPISTLGTRTIPDTLVRIPIQSPSTSS